MHPRYRGRGLGTRLLAWTEEQAVAAHSDHVGQTVTDRDRAAAELLRAHGYQPKHTAWILEIALDAEPVVPEPPAGITVRPFEPGRDERAAHRLIDDAFCEWPDRKPQSFEDWYPSSAGRDTFAPSGSPLAFDGDRLVGAARPAALRVPRIPPEGAARLRAVDELVHRRAVTVRAGRHAGPAQLHPLREAVSVGRMNLDEAFFAVYM